ncbi:MAG: adenylate/guanylate cyclase domain-containing protein [Coleofasciculaceae cyanobacterium]
MIARKNQWLKNKKEKKQLLPIFPKRLTYLPIGLTLLLGVGLSAAVSTLVCKWENYHHAVKFQEQADNLATTLQRQIDEYSYITLSVGAFYNASKEVTQESYQEFTEPFLSRYPGVLALGWSKHVPASERKAYEATMAAGGLLNIQVHEFEATGKKVRAGQRQKYFPITFSTHQHLVGFDLASHPVGQGLIEKAIDTGDLAASSRFTPIKHHHKTDSESVAIVKAIYHEGQTHDKVQARRQSYKGVIISAFSVDKILEKSLAGVNADHVDFYLHDESASQEKRLLAIYQSSTQQVVTHANQEKLAQRLAVQELCPNRQTCTHPIKVADREWSLLILPTSEYSGWEIHATTVVTLLSGLTLTGILLIYLWKSLHYTEEIEVERQKSERLLLNILPEPIAVRLKQKHQTIADSFAEVTVLFADIVGFTKLSQRVPPEKLVNLLNEIFCKFDELTERHGLEKIKTIGDAYMVAGGLPKHRTDHAEAIAEMALAMQEEVAKFSAKYGETLKIRIGINSGPVVAGVIGSKKFIYDLWGDAVNTASRMESHGIAGSIQVTADTYKILQDKYLLEERGIIEIKGKGKMTTYLLLGKKLKEVTLESIPH